MLIVCWAINPKTKHQIKTLNFCKFVLGFYPRENHGGTSRPTSRTLRLTFRDPYLAAFRIFAWGPQCIFNTNLNKLKMRRFPFAFFTDYSFTSASFLERLILPLSSMLIIFTIISSPTFTTEETCSTLFSSS